MTAPADERAIRARITCWVSGLSGLFEASQSSPGLLIYHKAQGSLRRRRVNAKDPWRDGDASGGMISRRERAERRPRGFVGAVPNPNCNCQTTCVLGRSRSGKRVYLSVCPMLRLLPLPKLMLLPSSRAVTGSTSRAGTTEKRPNIPYPWSNENESVC